MRSNRRARLLGRARFVFRWRPSPTSGGRCRGNTTVWEGCEGCAKPPRRGFKSRLDLPLPNPELLLSFPTRDLFAAGNCGCSSAVERYLAKVNVEGSIPFTRSQDEPEGFKAFRLSFLNRSAWAGPTSTGTRPSRSGTRRGLRHRWCHRHSGPRRPLPMRPAAPRDPRHRERRRR